MKVIKSLSKKSSPLLLALLSGLSVFYFLYFLDAYGIQKGLSYSGHTHLFRSLSFGALTALYLWGFEFFLKPKLKIKENWQHLLWYLALVLVGCQLVFLLFNFFWNWQEWDLIAYGLIVKEFPLMMIIPLAFYGLVQKLFVGDKNDNPSFLFRSENGKDRLQLELDNFLFAQSAENYITIYYSYSGGLKKHLIRKTLKKLEDELSSFMQISRCHRSYLVNKEKIEFRLEEKGKLTISVAGENIPVSTSFKKSFLKEV